MPFMQHDIRKGCIVVNWEYCDSGVFPLDMQGDFKVGEAGGVYTPEWVRRGALIEEVEVHEDKFCARLSAPGYTDCTDWSGPFDTEDAAHEYLNDTYGTDEESEPEDEEPVPCPACGGDGGLLGKLGSLSHYSCRNCGMQFSREV